MSCIYSSLKFSSSNTASMCLAPTVVILLSRNICSVAYLHSVFAMFFSLLFFVEPHQLLLDTDTGPCQDELVCLPKMFPDIFLPSPY